MNQALLSLLEKKDIEFITVTEITKKAGVNRSTFYLHYDNVYELLEETIEGLAVKPDGIYVDGTLGGAGHSYYIAKEISTKGTLIGIDRDVDALKAAGEKLKEFENVKYVNDNHDNIKNILFSLGIDKVDGILLDLGVSSYQLDEKNRGFSYMQDAKLDMRMDKSQELTAEYVVNNYKEEELTNIFFKYAEEKFSRSIARNIVKNRPINTTLELVEELKDYITKYFYNCTNKILLNLGLMYVTDLRFKNNIDKFSDGNSEYIKRAIELFCNR